MASRIAEIEQHRKRKRLTPAVAAPSPERSRRENQQPSRPIARTERVIQKVASQPVGVGEHLAVMLREIGAVSCRPCWELSRKMDAWGPEGCRVNRAKIVAEIAKNAAAWSLMERLGLGARAATKTIAWKLNPLDPYGSLVDEAIRRSDTSVIMGTK